eukprot:TRINITY_DN8531_c0_g1_i3.p1 TRINITY_DN8531_c0_g1~~TRINITY_DN8531_c0_g1_i3.p1  ORF type:complete len:300 (-),score=51.02 TRINITY_DN8531_c0_g1_i3:119-1018(-)
MAPGTHCKLVCVLLIVSITSAFRLRKQKIKRLQQSSARTAAFYNETASCGTASSSNCQPSLCANPSYVADTCCTLLRYMKSRPGQMCWSNVCSQLLSMFPAQCAHLKAPSDIQVPSGSNLPAGVVVSGPGSGGDFMTSVQMTMKTLLSQAPKDSTGSQIENAIQEGVNKAIAENMVTLKKQLKAEAHALWESLIPDLSKRIDAAIFKNNAEQRSRLGKSIASLTKDIGDAVSSHMKAFTEDLMVDDMPREDAPVEVEEKQEDVEVVSSEEEASDGTGEDAETDAEKSEPIVTKIVPISR